MTPRMRVAAKYSKIRTIGKHLSVMRNPGFTSPRLSEPPPHPTPVMQASKSFHGFVAGPFKSPSSEHTNTLLYPGRPKRDGQGVRCVWILYSAPLQSVHRYRSVGLTSIRTSVAHRRTVVLTRAILSLECPPLTYVSSSRNPVRIS